MAIRSPGRLLVAASRLAPAMLALSLGAAAQAQEASEAVASLPPGTVIRWQGAGTALCGVGAARWAPIGDTCWYPFDLLASEGPRTLWRQIAGRTQEITVRVGPYSYPEQRLEVAPEMVHPPPQELDRIRREQLRVSSLWQSELPRRFTLPLAAPLAPLPAASGFGSRRVLNGEPRSPHSGIDLPAAAGTTVRAAAAGTVILADDLYFSGNSVFIDHGDELVTMYFHLAGILVAPGTDVARGQPVGTVGATGRATGPHLHFGVRWHGARIDPTQLLDDPSSVPRILQPGPG